MVECDRATFKVLMFGRTQERPSLLKAAKFQILRIFLQIHIHVVKFRIEIEDTPDLGEQCVKF
jgi:hypothetical protein